MPSTAVSGVYLARLYRADDDDASLIPFIVRNDASHSDIVYQTSDPTWEAYNTYGGADFYQGFDNGRAYKVSYNRPFVTRGNNAGRDFLFSNEYPTIRFLEQNGYDVSYISGLDTDINGSSADQSQGLPVGRARRVLVGRPTHQRAECPRRRGQPGVPVR